MDHFPLIALNSLDSTTTLLVLFGSSAVLAILAYQIGLLTHIVRGVGKVIEAIVDTGFALWRHLLSWASWPVFLALVIGLHALAGHDGLGTGPWALLCGLTLIALGVITCLAYIYIDLERVDVGRGYKVLHQPVKGQELASNLVHYGPRLGIPLVAVAALATISGFALLNQGLFYTIGQHWYTLTKSGQHAISPEPVVSGEGRLPGYADFLAYTLINLSHVVDLLHIANTYNYTRITYVHQARWPASTLLVLFKSFFTLVLLQQIFAAVRRFKMLGETIQDYWNPHQPIHERAGLALPSFGASVVEPLLRSLTTAESLAASQRAEIVDILANIGPSTIPILKKHLTHPQENVRAVVITALGRLHALAALPHLVKASRDPSELVRLSLVEALGIIATPGTRFLRKKWRLRQSLQASRRWFGTLWRWTTWLVLTKERHPIDLVIDALHQLLTDSVTEIRLQAIQTLARFGGDMAAARSELLSLLADDEEVVRCQAAETLGKFGGPPEARVDGLRRLLQDASAAVRLAAVRALGGLGPLAQGAVAGLLPLLQDPEEQVSEATAEAIRHIGSIEPEAVSQLVAGLSSEDNLVRARTAELLGQIGPAAAAAVPVLCRALQDTSDRVRAQAAGALCRMGAAAAAAVPGLIRLLEDEDNRVNALAAEALGEIGEPAFVAVPALTRTLDHVNPEVRSLAAAALGKLSCLPRSTVSALARATQDENGRLRRQAIRALVETQAPAKDVRRALLAGLNDGDPDVRVASIQSLEKYGEATPELRQALLAALNDTSDNVKMATVRALAALVGGAPEVLHGLSQLLQGNTASVQIVTVQALGSLGRVAASTGPQLLRAFQTGDTSLRIHILAAFIKIQASEALLAFQAGLTDPDPSIRKMASAGLLQAKTLPDAVLPLLLDALKDPEDRVKANIAGALARIATIPAEALPLLQECLINLHDAVRLNAFRALKAASAATLPEVSQRLLHDSNLHVRLEAAQVLLGADPKDTAAAGIVLEALAAAVPAIHNKARETIKALGAEAVIFREILAQQGQGDCSTIERLLDQLTVKLACHEC